MTPAIKSIPYQSTWSIRHSVMWPDMPFDYVKLPEDQLGQHFGLFLDEELVSIVSVFFLINEVQFRKFATVLEHQGKGYGSTLLSHVLTALESKSLSRIWCNARIDKSDYYERFGLVATNQTYVKGGIHFVIMEKVLS